jgi:hypothetical protein
VVRIGALQSWTDYDETFGAFGVPGDTAVPLGSRLGSDALGVRELGALAPVEQDLRTLTGQTGLALSLGRTVVSASATSRTTTLDLEAGLGRGLSIGVLMPVVRTLAAVGVTTNAEGGEANVGLNPARYGQGAAAAVTANAAVKSQFEQAAARLRQQYGACFAVGGGAAPGCAEVVAFHTAATGYATTLERVYGSATVPGGPVVPIVGSAAQRGVESTVASFNARFAALFGTPGAAGPITGSPQGALPITEPDLQTLLTDPAGQFAQDSLQSISRITLGDVEVGLRLRLIDTFGGQESRRLTPAGLNVRATIAGTFRLGSSHLPSSANLVEIATGDGQNDVEVAGFTDLLFGERAWVALAARYGRQLADEQAFRIPFAGSGSYLPASALQTVDRDLGDYLVLEASPRFAVSRSFALEAQYRLRSKQADRYAGTFSEVDPALGAVTLDAALLGADSEQREQVVGAAATYSTFGAHARRRARFPLELSLGYRRVVAGRGGVPRAGTAQVQLRAYPRLFGADDRAPAPPRVPQVP